MSAPVQMDGPYRRSRTRRLRRALRASAVAAWVSAWLGIAMLALVCVALVVGMPFLAGLLSAYLQRLF